MNLHIDKLIGLPVRVKQRLVEDTYKATVMGGYLDSHSNLVLVLLLVSGSVLREVVLNDSLISLDIG